VGNKVKISYVPQETSQNSTKSISLLIMGWEHIHREKGYKDCLSEGVTIHVPWLYLGPADGVPVVLKQINWSEITCRNTNLCA